jgi:hypothetical protein
MRYTIAPALLIMSLVGCGSEKGAPTTTAGSISPSSAPEQSRQERSVPISGNCVLTFNPAPVPLPPVITQTDVGECRFSHLGHSTVTGVQSINFAAGTQEGQRTFTAANGDRLEMTHVGTSAPAGPGLVRFQSTATIVGGTGRFANARGQVTNEGTANLVTRTTTAATEGTIIYDASDRAER